MLRVLEVKAAAAEAASEVTDLAMRVCGGAAFRKEIGVERRFRDARAARVMAPTTDALLDFVGRAISACRCSTSAWPMGRRATFVMGAVAYDPKVVTIWDGSARWFAGRPRVRLRPLLNYERQVEDLLAGRIDVGVELAAGLGARPTAGRRRGRGVAPSPCATATAT